MDSTSFELNVSVPSDQKYVETVRGLAVHAARYAGCRGSDADRYGEAVEVVARRCLAGGNDPVPIVVRRGVGPSTSLGTGPVEVLIACNGKIETASRDAHITIEWIEEAGRRMCRVARAMPADV